MARCPCDLCPIGKTPKYFHVTGVTGVQNKTPPVCQHCAGYNNNGLPWLLVHDEGCYWHSLDQGICTPGYSVHLDFDSIGNQWKLRFWMQTSIAVYTCPAGSFHCQGTNTFTLQNAGIDCDGWPNQLTAKAQQSIQGVADPI
jgi:hypothetical protein